MDRAKRTTYQYKGHNCSATAVSAYNAIIYTWSAIVSAGMSQTQPTQPDVKKVRNPTTHATNATCTFGATL